MSSNYSNTNISSITSPFSQDYYEAPDSWPPVMKVTSEYTRPGRSLVTTFSGQE